MTHPIKVGKGPDMTMNNHSNYLNASNTYDTWVINYCAVKSVRVNVITICDSDDTEHVPYMTSEHKLFTFLFSVYTG